jgi:hypothetical protein
MMANNVVHRSMFDGSMLLCSITFSPMDMSGIMSGPEAFLNSSDEQSDKGTKEQVWSYADGDDETRELIVKET